MTHSSPESLSYVFAGCREDGRDVLSALLESQRIPREVWIPEEVFDEEEPWFQERLGPFGIPLIPFAYGNRPSLIGTDLLVCCRFPILPQEIFDAPRLGAINIHLSLLPQYPGVHPVSWALVDGRTETGVSLHRIDAGIDSGPILAQSRVAITSDDDYRTLHRTLRSHAQNLILQVFDTIEETGRLPNTRPSLAEEKTRYARRRTPDDSRIDWSAGPKRLKDLVRALPKPFPPAFTEDESGDRYLVRNVIPLPDAGTVLGPLDDTHHLVVNGSSISVVEFDHPPGKGTVLR